MARSYSAPHLGCNAPTWIPQRPACTTHALPAGFPSLMGCATSNVEPPRIHAKEAYLQVSILFETSLSSEHRGGKDFRWT